jgi:DnaJ-class molecular chaperone
MSKRYPVKPPVSIGERYEEKCRHCAGTGQEPGLTDLTCRECIGRGRRRWRVEECKECNGKGKKSFFSLTHCRTCRGRGWQQIDIG